jgi:hypothetical protein
MPFCQAPEDPEAVGDHCKEEGAAGSPVAVGAAARRAGLEFVEKLLSAMIRWVIGVGNKGCLDTPLDRRNDGGASLQRRCGQTYIWADAHDVLK